jgi:chromosome segregation ATPase
MSVPRQSVPTRDDDLESTAELPVLDIADYEAKLAEERTGHSDTWVIPPNVSTAVAVAQVEGVPHPPPPPAVPDGERIQLEVDLRSLSSSLREVEERLTRKGERLAQIERELSMARDERLAVEQRAESLNAALEIARAGIANAETRIVDLQQTVARYEAQSLSRQAQEQQAAAQLASREQSMQAVQSELHLAQRQAADYLESLQSLEGRRIIFEGMLNGLDQEVASRESELARLGHETAARAGEVRDLQAQLVERERRIATLERESNALAAALAQRDQQLTGSDSARDKLRESVASLTEMLNARAERIRTLEASVAAQGQTEVERQRVIQDLTSERDTLAGTVASLELSVDVSKADVIKQTHATRSAEAARAEVETKAATALERIRGLETALATARAEVEARVLAQRQSESEIAGLLARAGEAETRANEAQAEARDQIETLRVLQEELRVSTSRVHELEGDLHAAEDTINRLEAELRSKGSKLEEVTKTNEEFRDTVESARQVLSERESLIRRLEAEAANSAVLLGSIQQSIKRMDPASNSGTHEVVPEGAVRLLIRQDGDSEVVHVLSRKTSIGRTPDNDLQIDARFISRHHAVILAGPTHTIIEDLNSTNGVLVNNRRITRHTLRDGDQVAIGKTVFRFSVRSTGTERR